MLRRLISNLPYSPSLLSLVGVLRTKQKKETKLRLLSLLLLTLALGLNVITLKTSGSEPSLQFSMGNIVEGGIPTNSNVQNNVIEVAKNNTPLSNILDLLDITDLDISNASNSNIATTRGGLTLYSLKTSSTAGENCTNGDGFILCSRDLAEYYGNQNQNLQVIEGYKADEGSWFAIDLGSGNILTRDSPTLSSNRLSIESYLNSSSATADQFKRLNISPPSTLFINIDSHEPTTLNNVSISIALPEGFNVNKIIDFHPSFSSLQSPTIKNGVIKLTTKNKQLLTLPISLELQLDSDATPAHEAICLSTTLSHANGAVSAPIGNCNIDVNKSATSCSNAETKAVEDVCYMALKYANDTCSSLLFRDYNNGSINNVFDDDTNTFSQSVELIDSKLLPSNNSLLAGRQSLAIKGEAEHDLIAVCHATDDHECNISEKVRCLKNNVILPSMLVRSLFPSTDDTETFYIHMANPAPYPQYSVNELIDLKDVAEYFDISVGEGLEYDESTNLVKIIPVLLSPFESLDRSLNLAPKASSSTLASATNPTSFDGRATLQWGASRLELSPNLSLTKKLLMLTGRLPKLNNSALMATSLLIWLPALYLYIRSGTIEHELESVRNDYSGRKG